MDSKIVGIIETWSGGYQGLLWGQGDVGQKAQINSGDLVHSEVIKANNTILYTES